MVQAPTDTGSPPRTQAGVDLVEWRLLPGAEIDALDRERTIIVGSVSPIEVHGPHLPTTTDITEAEGLLHASLAKVQAARPDLTFVTLPPLWVASDVLPATGSISFRPDTLRRVLMDLGDSLAKQGFHHVWLSNFHGGPRHFVAMEDALHRVNRRHGTRMISVFSLLLSRLADDGNHELTGVLGPLEGVDREALVGDHHGGYIETSIMKHLLGPHIREYADLPPVTVSGWRKEQGLPDKPPTPVAAFRDSYRFFAANTYAGSPAGASAELGERFVEVLSDHTAEALVDVWDGKLGPDDARSPLFKWRRLLLSRSLSWVFEKFIA